MILSPDLATILATARSDAERRIARLLHQMDGGSDAVAFHSVKLRSHPTKQQAEADFIILWRGVVVVVEVKGGGVRHADGKWWTIDRRGDWNLLRESPMDQANDAKFALRDILRQEGLGWYADQHIVITPDVQDLEAAIGWLPTHWLAQDKMTVEAMGKALDRVVHSGSSDGRGKKARVDDIRERLFCEFTRLPMIDAQRGAVLEEQNHATAGQAKYLAGLAKSPRILVQGGAGTGKSLALAEGARQDADQGMTVLVTFRSPGLAPFFEALLRGTSIDIVPFGALSTSRKYDAVFVDEAQDLMTAEDMDKLDEVVEGGRSSGRWRMFLDPNNQAHVDGSFDPVVYQFVLDEAVEFDLPLNVRNTKPIVHVVQSYLGADVGDPAIVHGEKLHWHEVADGLNLQGAISVAEELVAAGADPTSLWVIDVSSEDEPAMRKEGFVVTSPRFAKGLEADRVVVGHLPSEFDAIGTASFYVAVTRARVALHIAVSGADRKHLQRLLRGRQDSQ